MAEKKINWYERSEIGAIVTILIVTSNQLFGIELTESDFQQAIEAISVAVAGVVALAGNYLNRNSEDK